MDASQPTCQSARFLRLRRFDISHRSSPYFLHYVGFRKSHSLDFLGASIELELDDLRSPHEESFQARSESAGLATSPSTPTRSNFRAPAKGNPCSTWETDGEALKEASSDSQRQLLRQTQSNADPRRRKVLQYRRCEKTPTTTMKSSYSISGSTHKMYNRNHFSASRSLTPGQISVPRFNAIPCRLTVTPVMI